MGIDSATFDTLIWVSPNGNDWQQTSGPASALSHLQPVHNRHYVLRSTRDNNASHGLSHISAAMGGLATGALSPEIS